MLIDEDNDFLRQFLNAKAQMQADKPEDMQELIRWVREFIEEERESIELDDEEMLRSLMTIVFRWNDESPMPAVNPALLKAWAMLM